MITGTALQLLEFDSLLGTIAGAAHSEVSRTSVLGIKPLSSADDIRERFDFVRDIRRIHQLNASLRLQSFGDIARLLALVRPAGAVLEASDVAQFVPVLDMTLDLREQVMDTEGIPALQRLVSSLIGQEDLLRTIRRSVDPDGTIRDSASPALAAIRRDLRRLETNIQKKLEDMTRDQSVAVFLQDDFITKRAGRWVIPVRMDSKGLVAGVVHDVSKSGETAFIEPLAIIHLSNEFENLAADEKAEELRILRVLSASIRDAADLIEADFAVIVHLDLLNCVARIADDLGMEEPEINTGGSLRLRQARHPLLTLLFRRHGQEGSVVPLDLQLGAEETIMVITGSNAGGKTIAIKTVGLLTCMALSGIPVPADESSSFPLVDSLLADMGDEQSIEANLSTFSAHMRNIASILSTAGRRTLVLLDELGTGTDPDEGAALACSVLKELQEQGALVCATTHLMGIKGYVHRTAGMVNASMEFDRHSLTPLFRLRTGEPGQSHALEIARKYGLGQGIIDRARELLGGNTVELEALMEDLRHKRDRYELLLAELAGREETLASQEKNLEGRASAAEKERKDILADAYRESLDIVREMRRRLNDEIAGIKERDKKELQQRLKETEREHRELSEKLAAADADTGQELTIEQVAVGDTVFVRSLGYDGTITGIMPGAGRVKVTAGSKEVLVPVQDIRLRRGRAVAEARRPAQRPAGDDTASSRLNLVGQRVDAALSLLEPFLNHAALDGFQEVTVIHGVGTGTLQRAVREHLSGHPLVAGFRSGEQSEGGAGVTVVSLK